MPGVTTKQMLNERAARLKAQKQRVYISGVAGQHSLETGVAYHYRGHFIYACPAANPIDPIPYSTRKGISLVGTVRDRAPHYDPQATNLVPERDIAALQRSRIHYWHFQQQQETALKEEIAKALEEEEKQTENVVDSAKNIDVAATLGSGAHEPSSSHPPSRVASSTALSLLPQSTSRVGSHTSLASLAASSHRLAASLSNVPQIGTVQSPSIPSVTAYAPQTHLGSHSYTPHDRAQFLAASAPGSRHVSVTNTPHTSRPVSPTHGFGIRGSLRAIASTSRINQLLTNEDVRRAFSPLQEVAEGRAFRAVDAALEQELEANLSTEWIDPDDIDAFVQTVSRPASRPVSRSLSRSQSPNSKGANDDMNDHLYLPGLGHVDVRRHHLSGAYSPPVTYDAKSNTVYLHGQGTFDTLHPPSKTQSTIPPASHEPWNTSLHLPGAGHMAKSTHHGGATNTSSFPTFQDTNPHSTGGPSSSLYSRDLPIGTGRPRKASLALNSAYNAANPPVRPVFQISAPEQSINVRVPKCAIHDETCDGVTTTEKHLTQRMRETIGFKDLYPTIVGQDGRVMIDWARIKDEEMQ